MFDTIIPLSKQVRLGVSYKVDTKITLGLRKAQWAQISVREPLNRASAAISNVNIVVGNFIHV